MASNSVLLSPQGKSGKTRMVVLSLIAMLAMLLVACGGPGTSATTAPGAKAPVTINILASPNGAFTAANFNPLVVQSASNLSGNQGMIYETLIFQNRATGEITPWLASDYKLADDASSISFTIRQGVKWSDGQPFSADDVMFTLNLLKQYPALDSQSLWTNIIKSIATPDANTIAITFQKPDSTATWAFAQQFIVSKHAWSSVSDPTTALDSQPVGTGPYMVKSFTPQVYTLVKNPNYWQADKIGVDRLRYLSTNDNTAAQLLISQGQIDWAGVGWDPKYDAAYTQKDPTHYHHWFPSTNTVMLYLNLTKPMFSDLNVRKAISLAIDRDQIHQTAAVYANPANPSAILPSNKDWIASEYQSAQFKLDQATARQLLQQAGWTPGPDGILTKGGQKFSFTMIVPNGWNDWVSSLQVISSNLKAVGIDAKVNALASPEVYTGNRDAGNYDAAISWTNAGPTPIFFLQAFLQGSNTWDTATKKTATGTNWEHWKDPATDTLINQYLATADPTAQKQAIAGLEKIIVDQLPSIPLDYNVGWFEYTTTHVTGWPDDSNPYDYGSPFNAPDNEFVILHLKAA
ncbi:MAG TPA: ABC transporter substrate-binding protein [Ktedonosporobacter sp.]|nr:ABC transporter substrate-binding protein [Ktedonosporobacter sp.]